MACRATSGRSYGVVLGKELADVFERAVLPRLVGPARNGSRCFSSDRHALNPSFLSSTFQPVMF
jgi:hypothetical protein